MPFHRLVVRDSPGAARGHDQHHAQTAKPMYRYPPSTPAKKVLEVATDIAKAPTAR